MANPDWLSAEEFRRLVRQIADYGNAVKESDETNNSLAGNQIAVQVP